MVIPATWLDETQVNITPLTFTTSSSTETRVIQLSNGNLLITWRSEVISGAAAAPGIDIIGRLFNPLGEPIGGEFRVNASAFVSNEYAADIAATANGGFVAVYEVSSATERVLRIDEFDSQAAPVSSSQAAFNLPTFVPPGSSVSSEYQPQVVAINGDTVFITFRGNFGSITNAHFGTTYNLTQNLFGGIFYIAQNTIIADTVILNDGRFVTLGQSQSSSPSSIVYSVDLSTVVSGNYVSSAPRLFPYGTGLNRFIDGTRPETTLPDIISLAGGGFAVAYATDRFVRQGLSILVDGYDFTIRTYDNAGNLTGQGDFSSSGFGGGNRAESPKLAALPNGNFELVYRDPRGALHAIDYSPTAQSLGETVFANRPLLSAGDLIEPTSISLADGRFAVVWTTTNGSTSNIVLEILDSRTSATQSTTTNPPGQIGTPFDDAITLAPASTYIAVGPGDDTLTAGATPARLIGGTGDDIYIIATELDTIVEQAGGGRDEIRTSTAHLDIPANVEDAFFTGTGTSVIGGNGLDNRITGGVSYDVLVGFGANDTLVGGMGAANEMIGGAGDDVYVSNAMGDSIVELAGGGTDRIETVLPIYVLRNQVENLTYTGAAGFLGIGNELANFITGGVGRDDLYGRDGNDIITGGAGPANTLLGNAGDDIFIVAAVGDSVVEYVNEGTDRVETALGSFRLPTNVEQLIFTGIGSFVGFGNDVANVITGGASADTLSGFGGADRLIGGMGVPDTLIGGTQDDIYVIGSITGTSIVEVAGEGIDTVETTAAAYTLSAANVEILRYTGTGAFAGTGNDLDNVLYGAGGADILRGLGGADLIFGYGGEDIIRGGSGAADTLFGGLGNDVYFVDAVGTSVIESVGEGNDRVEITTAIYNMPENVEHVRYIGSGNFTGTGSNGNDRIEGGGLADVLSGGLGNDVIVGKSSADILSGGAGADQFRYNGGELGIDQILDFTPGTDKIVLALPSLDDAGFTCTLNLALVQGPGASAATSADATFIYDSTTGLLSYDADGSRVGLTAVLAQLAPGLTLSIGDFMFV